MERGVIPDLRQKAHPRMTARVERPLLSSLRGALATKAIRFLLVFLDLPRGAGHRAALCADPLARRDDRENRCEKQAEVRMAASRIHVHEIPQQRIDFVIPAPAAEDAVMADAGLHVMHLAIGAHAGAEVLRGERLPD
jgi:hypothetical protein